MKKSYFFLYFLFLLFSDLALAEGEGLHQDPITPVLLGLLIFFLGAKLGGALAQQLKQPAVLGELLAGILIGNLGLIGIQHFKFIYDQVVFEVFASLGVILLLFEVGLESNLKDLMKVGLSAFMVAVVGVLAPSLLGLGTSSLLLPEASFYTHLFVGTTLCATSVGITARVLKDLGKTQSQEAKIILGAAVIDDVLGLIVLAIVSGLIASSNAVASESLLFQAFIITLKAFGFLALSIFLGTRFAPRLFQIFARLRVDGSLLAVSLIFCFALSYLSNLVGLAPIVGAFAAGLIIDSAGFSRFFSDKEKSLEDLIHPLSKFFVPIFFVHMGMQVELSTFMNFKVLLLGLILGFVGILGKQVCGLAVVKGKEKINKLAIGIGMIPRGEVGLIFASIGSQLKIGDQPVISSDTYSAIIIMVIITTVITPPALNWALKKSSSAV